MSCTYNHNDSTKKFCPECGTKMTVDLTTRLNELLKEVITENKYNEFNPKNNAHMKQLLVKMMDNEISIKGKDNFVIFNNEIFTLLSFVNKYPFLTIGNNSYEVVDKLFFIPINFEQKQKEWKRCIPNDASFTVKNMLHNIMDTFDTQLFVEDKNIVITTLQSYCDKITSQRGKYTTIDYIRYFLQDINFKINSNSFCLNHQNDNNYEKNFESIDLNYIYENKLEFVVCKIDNLIALRITKTHIIRKNRKGFWLVENTHTSAKKEEIKTWFEDCPFTFKRNLDIETEFLKTVSD